MDLATGELSPEQQEEWQMYLDALDKEEQEIEARKKAKSRCLQ